MEYRNAEELLPRDLLEKIQFYIEGGCLYIPKRNKVRRKGGAPTEYQQELSARNTSIMTEYISGMHIQQLSHKYHLSIQSIYRIVKSK